jgi:hypothetical protein
MTLVRWMVAGSIGSAVLAMLAAGDGGKLEIVLGMGGPLLVASGSWVMTERTWRRQPERLTAVMMTAFAGKLVFFAAYVALMLSVLSLRPVPFVISFTSYFIGLHLVEALSLRRLFAGAGRQSFQ